MKKFALLVVLIFIVGISTSDAQVLRGLGKRIEKKIEDRIDRKADRNIDKVLDKADRKTDEPIDDVLSGSNRPKNKSKTETAVEAETKPQVLEEEFEDPEIVRAKALSDGLIILPSGSCSDFIWFKQGAMMEFETKDGKGSVLNKSRMEIVKISNDGGVTVADALTSDDEGNSFEMQFKCASDRMYMDFGSLLKQAMLQAGQEGADQAQIERALENTEIGFSDGFMDFPKSMYPGQALKDVSISITTSPTPNVSMDMVSTLSERRVVGKEKVTTPAGTFDAMKISGVRKTTMKIMGMNKKMPSSTEYLWFAPGIGVVKQEDYNEKGSLGASMQLTSYKL